MKSLIIRALASIAIGVIAAVLLLGATAPKKPATPSHANQVVIISTADVKGKTSPCG